MAISRSGDSLQKPLEQLTDEEFWNYARSLTGVVPVAALPEEFLECGLRRGRCLVPLAKLYEVVSAPYSFARLPATPAWMLGLHSWRGAVIAVVDLDMYLFGQGEAFSAPLLEEGGNEFQLNNDGALLIADFTELPVGLFVPVLGPITSVEHKQVISLTTTPAPGLSLYPETLKGTYGDFLVLDVPVLLADIVQQIEMAAINE